MQRLGPCTSAHYDLPLSCFDVSLDGGVVALALDLSVLDELDDDGVDADGDDGLDEAIDDDEPDGLDGVLDGVDCDMLDELGGVAVVDDVCCRSLHATISNAETIATDNAEAFITSPFVTNAN